MIEPATAELNIASPRTTHWARLNAEERAKIMQHYIQDAVIESFPPSDFLFGIFASKFRVVEEEILNGSPLYVHGDFHTSEGLPTAVKVPVLGLFWDRIFDSVGSRLKNISTLLDKNKDGNVSEQEARDGYSLIAKMSIAKAKLDIHSESSSREFQLCGHLKSSAQHQLLIADAHEHHLVHRLSRFLWLQFSGGAAMVALSIFLMLPKETSSFSKPKERSVASAQELQNHLDPVKLHHDCIQGTSLSCENLLDHKHEYKLSTPQIQYYRSRLCSLGRVDACETKK